MNLGSTTAFLLELGDVGLGVHVGHHDQQAPEVVSLSPVMQFKLYLFALLQGLHVRMQDCLVRRLRVAQSIGEGSEDVGAVLQLARQTYPRDLLDV